MLRPRETGVEQIPTEQDIVLHDYIGWFFDVKWVHHFLSA